MIYVVSVLLIAVLVGGFVVFLKITKLKDIKESLEMCACNIEKFLDKKSKIVTSLLKEIDDEKIKKDFSYSEDFNIYEKEDSLFTVSWNINKYIKDNKLSKFKDSVKDLNILEENLDGLKDFYNANVLNYNEIFLKKYSNFLFRFFNFKDYKSFKIRKLEEYEIFKL